MNSHPFPAARLQARRGDRVVATLAAALAIGAFAAAGGGRLLAGHGEDR